MSLNQILSEIEPIFRDGTFTMPSFQEVLTAKQFADEINSRRLSVIDAYEHFWSRKEKADADLWGLFRDGEFSVLSNGLGHTLLHTATMLNPEENNELINIMSKDYSIISELIDSYNNSHNVSPEDEYTSYPRDEEIVKFMATYMLIKLMRETI